MTLALAFIVHLILFTHLCFRLPGEEEPDVLYELLLPPHVVFGHVTPTAERGWGGFVKPLFYITDPILNLCGGRGLLEILAPAVSMLTGRNAHMRAETLVMPPTGMPASGALIPVPTSALPFEHLAS